MPQTQSNPPGFRTRRTVSAARSGVPSGNRPAPVRLAGLFCVALTLLPFSATARVGVEYQMALGNPSGATADATNRTNYLIARDQYAMSYNDDTHQANWVSWSYSSADSGPSGRTDAWSVETSLPAGYLRIGTASFGTGWDRGHMCPSADRTLSVADNEFTFRMSNIIPQASSNNQGLWATFETYCRGLAADGSELMVVSGPSGFSGATISNGMAVPGGVWKIVVKLPAGQGTAVSRLGTGCRVIALLTPNTSTGLGGWQSYITSVENIEDATGLVFFPAADPAVATYLKNVVDTGAGPNNPTVITSFSPRAGAAGTAVNLAGYNFGSAPVVRFNGTPAVSAVAGDGSVSAVVPAGASTGEISVTGTGGTDTSGSAFTVLDGSSPSLALSVATLSGFSATEGSSGPGQMYTLAGNNLTGSVAVAASSGFEVSADGASYAASLVLEPSAGALTGVRIYARLAAGATSGAVSGVISHTGGGAAAADLAVSGTVVPLAPTLSLSVQTLSGFTAAAGAAGEAKAYTVSGTRLSGGVSVTAPAGFEVSADGSTYAAGLVLSPADGTLATVQIHVRMSASSMVGPVSGSISHAGGGAETQTLQVAGTVGGGGMSGEVKLAAWETGGLTAYGPSPLAAASADASVSVTGLTRGSGVTTLNTAAGGAWGGNGFDGTAAVADAVARGDFATFSLTVAGGSRLSLSRVAAYNIRRSSTGPTSGQWQYRSGAGDFSNIGGPVTWGPVTTSAGNPQPEISLSGIPALAAVEPGVEITFRLVIYGASGSAGNFYLNNQTGDDLAVFGATDSTPSAVPAITSPATAAATAFEPFFYQATATNGPVAFSASGLPAGLSIDPATGIVSGTPTAPGIYPAVLTASNADGDGTADLTVTVAANPGAPAFTGPAAAAGFLRAPFSCQIDAANAPTAYFAANLPPGLEIDSATGRISGVPAAAGVWNVAVTVQNALGSGVGSLPVAISDPVLAPGLPGIVGMASVYGSAGNGSVYHLSGSHLTGAVTIKAPEGFEISAGGGVYAGALEMAPSGETLSIAITVRLAADAPLGPVSGAIIHTGGGAVPVYLPVEGTVSAPQPALALSASSLGGFATRTGTPSVAQSYTVSGAALTGAVTVTAPPYYEIGTDGVVFGPSVALQPVNGQLASVAVFVRLSADAPVGSRSGEVAHSGGGAAAVALALSGAVSGTGPVIVSARDGSAYAGSAHSFSITVEDPAAVISYAAEGLPAGLSVNSATGVISGTPSAAGTFRLTLSATSAAGTTSVSYSLRVLSQAEQSAIPLNVVVNKFWNGANDVVELLVTGDTDRGPRVDLRGMMLKDFSSNMSGDQGGRFIFADSPVWAAVKAGTLIVLSSGNTAAEDLRDDDFLLRANLGNAACFTPSGGGFDLGNVEMVMIKAAGMGSDGVAGGVHALAAGTAGSRYTAFTGRKVRSSRELSTRRGYYAYCLNGTSKLSDFHTSGGADVATSLSFGSANTPSNGVFIQTLRGLDQDPPVVTLAGSAAVTVCVGSVYTDPGATASDAVDGATVVFTSGTVDTGTPGIYPIRYSSTDAAGNVSAAVERTVTVMGAFDFAMTGTHGLSGAAAARDADPDGDGMSNAYEFAFGTDPTKAGGSPVTHVLSGGQMKVSFPGRDGVSYVAEISDDLRTWTAGGAAAPSAVQPAGIPAGYTLREVAIPVSGTRGFIRVRALVP